jgi:cytoskeletal protein RodZ
MPETIGQQLKKARLERGLTLDQTARVLHIRPKYLEALEQDQRKELPSPVQGKGFLRMYAEYLELPVQTLLDAWDGKPVLIAPVSPPEAIVQPEEIPPAEPPLPTPPSPPLAAESFPKQIIELPHSPNLTPFDPASQTVFIEIGSQLSRQRQALGLSLAEVERYIHVRLHYLQALEEGQIDNLPSPVQGRGMLSNYARFLNLDVDALLLQFAEGLQSNRVERVNASQPAKKAAPRVVQSPKTPQNGTRGLLSRDLLLGSLVVAIILGFAIWVAAQVDAFNNRAGTPTPISIADFLLNNPTLAPIATGTSTQPALLSTLAPGQVQTSKPGSGNAQPATTLTIPVSGTAPIQVYVVARMRAYLRITVDGKVTFDGRVVPGNAYTYAGDKKIELLTGSAAALQVFYNSKDLGVLGVVGQVKALVFTKDGAVTPTSQFTATATRTSQPSATLRPSPTQPAATVTPLIP